MLSDKTTVSAHDPRNKGQGFSTDRGTKEHHSVMQLVHDAVFYVAWRTKQVHD